jgi:hypothetical protein
MEIANGRNLWTINLIKPIGKNQEVRNNETRSETEAYLYGDQVNPLLSSTIVNPPRRVDLEKVGPVWEEGG